MNETAWTDCSVARSGEPGDGVVDVWLVDLAISDTREAWFGAVLTPEEREQAGRFVRPDLSRRFVVARGALRRLLAGYTSVDAARIVFACGDFGKPVLSAGQGGRLHFNVSHSEDLALIAVSRSFDVGVDLEREREGIDAASIVAQQFSGGEKAAWASLSEAERLRAFFSGWVRKEAYVKGLGTGLAYPAPEYSVSLTARETAGRVDDRRDPVEGARWRLFTLEAAKDFTAALAVRCESVAPVVRTWRYNPSGEA